MQELAMADAVEKAYDALVQQRLSVLLGAGLSMAPPSSLPSAAEIAAWAKARYDATYCPVRPPLPVGIEDQAEFFFHNGQLDSLYFRTLIDPNAFAGRPNLGHIAAADLILVRAVDEAITTNVDTLIETAGQQLLGQIEACLDGNDAASVQPLRAPLLKLHGCRSQDRAHMIWARGQLAVSPWLERITHSKSWLSARLLDRDLVIIGFATDWDYLNELLKTALGGCRPSRIIFVNPLPPDEFALRAPDLIMLGQEPSITVSYVRVSGDAFLNALRIRFSQAFVQIAILHGRDEFELRTGSCVDPEWLVAPSVDPDVLWQIRRDLEGRTPTEPAQDREPAQDINIGLTILQLRAAGAQPEGPNWSLRGHTVRVLRTPNQPLHRAQASHGRGDAPAIAAQITIAVGSDDSFLPADIARPAQTSTIARGYSSRWLTRQAACQELGL